MEKRINSKQNRRQFLRQVSGVPWLMTGGVGLVGSALSAKQGGKIKVGQIGTMHAHASGKIQSLRTLSDLYEVVGVVEADPLARVAAQKKSSFRGLPFMSEEALLNTPGLQAVAVETKVEQLVPTAMRCLQAGYHIHLDKPAGESMSACRRMHALAGEKKRTIQMGYMFRYNSGFEFLFDVLEKGWLGEVREVTGMIGKLAGPDLRRGLAQFQGGGMFELACHLIDAVVTVLGPPDSVSPFSRRTHREIDSAADNQLAVFEYPKAIASVRCNHLDPFGFPRRQFNVTGENGTLEIRPLEAPRVRMAVDRPQGPYEKGFLEVSLPAMTGRYDGEFRDLAKVILGDKALAWGSEHDLAVHEAVLRASGMPVD